MSTALGSVIMSDLDAELPEGWRERFPIAAGLEDAVRASEQETGGGVDLGDFLSAILQAIISLEGRIVRLERTITEQG
jgi:hypothetical protein